MDGGRVESLSSEIFEEIFSLCSRGLLIIDAGESAPAIVGANAVFLSQSGYTREELEGTSLLMLAGLADQAPELAELRQGLAGGTSCKLHLPYFHKDGQRWGADLTLSPLTSSDSESPLWLVQFESEQSIAPADIDSTGRLPAGAHAATRLLSRTQFEMHCRRELGTARREQRTLSLMLWAVPELEIYRETFGNKAADSCLRMIGTQVTGTFRGGSDLCAQFDDSILAVAVSGLDETQAAQRVARVEKKVRNLALHNPRGRLSRYLSVRGLAVQADADESLATLYTRAVEALAACGQSGPQGIMASG